MATKWSQASACPSAQAAARHRSRRCRCPNMPQLVGSHGIGAKAFCGAAFQGRFETHTC